MKNREYECFVGFDALGLDFTTSIAGFGGYIPCTDMFSPTTGCSGLGYEESHIIINGVGVHLASGSGPLSFNYKKTDKYIVISNLECYESMVLTLELLSNDTLRVVTVTGTAPVGLNAGDIFK